VVDLWGTGVGNYNYNGDTLQTVRSDVVRSVDFSYTSYSFQIWSSTKSLTSIAMACLVDRGLLDYGEKVCTYWPQFAHNGKAHIKVEDVMRHEAGMAWFNHSFSPEDMSRESIKNNSIGRIIEEEPFMKVSKEKEITRACHALTRGWILNEIFRRVDPLGRTIGEFFRQEISQTLKADAYIGVTEAELKRYQSLVTPGTT
jgi:CubicO group peptidase (beta-lactamase class C family)